MVIIHSNYFKYLLFPTKLIKSSQFSRQYCFLKQQLPEKQRKCSSDCLWKVLFFGTDDFALESLKRLNQEYRSKRLLDRLEAVTAYDGGENAVLKYAHDHGIKVHHWPLKNPISGFDIGVVVSFGHLISSSVINSFPLGMVNVHASLLPRWRGAAPVVYALINGDKVTGVTIMKIAPKKFDIGEILDQQKVEIGDHETQPELHRRLAVAGGDLLAQNLSKLPNIVNEGRPQSRENITFAPKINKSLGVVKWKEMTAEDVYNLQRALTGLFPLKTTLYGKPLGLFGVKLARDLPRDVYLLKSIPGLIFYDEEKSLLMVQCKHESWITVDMVTLPGKRKITGKDFSNGHIKNRRHKKIILGDNDETKVDKVVAE